MTYDVNGCGLFLSSSIARQIFVTNLYHAYLIGESLNASEEYKSKIQDAIDSEKSLDYIETLIKESDYYDSLLNFALVASDVDEFLQ